MGAMLWWLAATFVLTAMIHSATIYSYPYLLVWVWRWQLASRGGTNRFLHGPPPTPEDRHLPRLASPDLAYSAAAFDLLQGPLRIQAPVTEPYSSVSVYAANTDNFFVVNDRQAQGGQFEFILVGPRSPDPNVPNIPVVRAPSRTGVILLRYLVLEKSQLEVIDSLRPQTTCTPLNQ